MAEWAHLILWLGWWLGRISGGSPSGLGFAGLSAWLVAWEELGLVLECIKRAICLLPISSATIIKVGCYKPYELLVAFPLNYCRD
ncbi:hypothetical protein VNO77_19352 [Canavalia gladiata]|uniref:Secreted protein n=1 Tax=Canavalia gladiata TaxID=3824 RepID=A0AAN9LRD7_CANGL